MDMRYATGVCPRPFFMAQAQQPITEMPRNARVKRGREERRGTSLRNHDVITRMF